jgi:hypothetical protein
MIRSVNGDLLLVPVVSQEPHDEMARATVVQAVPVPLAAYEGAGANAVKASPAPAPAEAQMIKTLIKTHTDMNFGDIFKKKNKRATQATSYGTRPLDDPCAVVIHDYGPDRYECYDANEKFTDVIQMLRALPVLETEKPDWAHVRSHD